MKFRLKSAYKPSGHQPQAIETLVKGLGEGFDKQTLLGVTGSGKTFTVANVIERVQKPTLVIAHNKTLAAQLCNEFREFFPDNVVEYFVSYYDYYQPEAYIPHSDTYIEKEAQINEEIDRLRHACTQALLTRNDVIIVASVSAIYGLGSPKEYEKIVLHLEKGQKLDRRGMLDQLITMQFERTNADLKRGCFRMRGQVFEIMPVNEERIYRFEVGETIERIEIIDPLQRTVVRDVEDAWFFPAKHYVVSDESREKAFHSIRKELDEQLALFQKQGKVVEYERLKRRVAYDLEMIKNIGYCNGIENYSPHFEARTAGDPPFTLIDYFKYARGEDSFLTVIDESHVTIPQIRGMYNGDRARKDTLVNHGFRLPSARDNRPLTFDEFDARAGQMLFVSATPSVYEMGSSKQVAEQIVRPTGLIDPEIIIRPITGRKQGTNDKKPGVIKKKGEEGIIQIENETGLSQVEDAIIEIEKTLAAGERVIVTTLTKKMAEDLSEFLHDKKIKVKFLHSDIQTLERIEIITDLRRGNIDVIVGVNLLREGLDIPEVSLVAILDADKEGFLRSETSLIQTIGRAARNINGRVIMYADHMTKSIEKAISETKRRRIIQLQYNEDHGIAPTSIQKEIKNLLEEFGISGERGVSRGKRRGGASSVRGSVVDLDILGDGRPLKQIIKAKELQMKEASQKLEFELAAILRDEIRELMLREKIADKKTTKK